MQITLTKEQVKEAFWRTSVSWVRTTVTFHDKDSKKKTEEVEVLKLHLGSMKLGNSVDIRLEATELPKIESLCCSGTEEPVYAPYVQRETSCISEKITRRYPPCSKQNYV